MSGGFRALRILILLIILAVVALDTGLTRLRSTDWRDSLRIVVYPINADGSSVSADYIHTLKTQMFADIVEFVDTESRKYGIDVREPIDIKLAAPVVSQPPDPPKSGMLAAIVWSLKMRYWAWNNDDFNGPAPEARIFVRYYDPATHRSLPHSVGIKEGLIGLVNAYASSDMSGSNDVVILHEILHTLGATDKYDPVTNMPIYPNGYADLSRQPSFPQDKAEIMAGRIPLSESEAVIPRGLYQVIIGDATAGEIGWMTKE